MIDFQSGGLKHQVYELIAKMCDLGCSDEFPHFQTKQLEDEKWECELSIPGVKQTSVGCGNTEVESINNCASQMMFILKTDYPNDDYDPEMEDNIFCGNIDQFFGDVDYDEQYKYHLCETDILINKYDDLSNVLLRRASRTIEKIENNNEEIESMSEIVTIRLLVKQKKTNYC